MKTLTKHWKRALLALLLLGAAIGPLTGCVVREDEHGRDWHDDHHEWHDDHPDHP